MTGSKKKKPDVVSSMEEQSNHKKGGKESGKNVLLNSSSQAQDSDGFGGGGSTLLRCTYNKIKFRSAPAPPYRLQDACTQVRPKCAAEKSCDMDVVAGSLEGQYVMLTRVTHILHNLQDESKAQYEHICQLLEIKAKKDSARTMESLPAPYIRKMDSIQQKFSICASSDMINGPRRQSSVGSNMRCPGTCPSCGNTIRLLMAEIDELRRSRQFLLHVRNEANEILDQVMAAALASRHVCSISGASAYSGITPFTLDDLPSMSNYKP